MWKTVAISTTIFMTLTNAVASTNKPSEPFKSAKLAYPHSLIGNGFGILTEEDLAANTCTATPEPFSQDSTSFPYWQCFKTEHMSFLCDSSGVPDPNDGVQGLIVLRIASNEGNHEYLARRPWDIESCRRFGKRVAALTSNTSHVCLSGAFHRVEAGEKGSPLYYWDFDKIKTRHGCDSYFVGDCDLKYKIKHGCKTVQEKPKESE